MRIFDIVTDSSCDLTARMAEALQVTAVPLYLKLGDATYRNFLDEREITFHALFAQLRTSTPASTAAPNIEDFTRAIRPLLAAGRDVLVLSFSSALSSTYANAVAAAKELKEEFPDRKLLAIDTKCASLGQGLLLHTVAHKADEGIPIEEAAAYAQEKSKKLAHWFTCENLTRLRMGGRISATSALLGGLLSIKPVMHVDDEGRLVAMSKVRGRRGSIHALAEHVSDSIVDPEKQTIFISHGDCLEDAKALQNKILERIQVKGFEYNYVGPVVAAHAGAGVLAVFFYGKER